MSSSSETSSVPLSSGIVLEVKVSHAIKTVSSTGNSQLAFLLHPWSRLGGSLGDPTLRLLVKPLQDRNYHVVRFNSRGVGGSTGSPSWTGNDEVEDFKEIVQWGLKSYPEATEVLLVGYSHGSLISSRHPMLPSPYKTTFLIISYPLSPRGALTLFRSSTYQSALLALAHTPSAEILIVYGTDDNFTAKDKYDRWADGLKQGAQAKLDVVKIEDGTHFWQGDHKLKLHSAVFTWLDKSSGRS